MKILLTNDDGFNEPGLKILREKLAGTHDVWSVAPKYPSSGASLSLGLHDSMVLVEEGKRNWSLTGSPVDCVKLALQEILPESKPDLLISGINPGANLANNTLYSGTVGAATEGALWEIPSIAISIDLANYPGRPFFGTAVFVIEKLIRSGIHKHLPPNTLLNVNVPAVEPDDITSFEWTVLGSFAEDAPFDCKSDGSEFSYGGYIPLPLRRKANTDAAAIAGKSVSLTILTSDRTYLVSPDTLGLPSLLSH